MQNSYQLVYVNKDLQRQVLNGRIFPGLICRQRLYFLSVYVYSVLASGSALQAPSQGVRFT